MACLISLYRTNELPFHVRRAMENGITRDEIAEVIIYSGLLRGLATGEHCCGYRAQGVRRSEIAEDFLKQQGEKGMQKRKLGLGL